MFRATLGSMPVWSKTSRASQRTASTLSAAMENAEATQMSVDTTNALKSSPPRYGTDHHSAGHDSTEHDGAGIYSTEKSSTEKKAAVSVGQGHPEGSEEFRKWLSGLKPVTGADTMLRFTKTPEGSIDLTHAHPSGLAHLMVGRRTRLSTLIRDRQQ